MVMTAEEQATFVKQSLGPAFKNAGINTKLLCMTTTVIDQIIQLLYYQIKMLVLYRRCLHFTYME